MDVLLPIILLLALTGLISSLLTKRRKKAIITGPFPEPYRDILTKQVPFYQQLNESNKKEFENRIQKFLQQVRITGVKTNVQDLDKVLIAASAIIPIFKFPGWEYLHLHECYCILILSIMNFSRKGGIDLYSVWLAMVR